MKKEIKKNNRGFVLLFAVTLAAILLSIALGVSSVALKEIKFGTSARDSNDAFFAADTGVEQVLFNDKDPNKYPLPGPGQEDESWKELFFGLGSTDASCASVTITKNSVGGTIIISKGHSRTIDDSCSSGSNVVERQLVVRY
ncbi:MAG: hypothetical protein UU13_C0002G0036 [Candidatus Nomurabacteria bacterium GW2011_GWB1_40_7]|uniref:Type 4 fimbrial biogenesis protein PilX N-terminal domain-containing protein n=1 Tax=Candidatus Nomurabacteria bacterium GW2011_GWB1_40_7 TaxID=1618744 RepID=A0A0G0T7G9_9BACT|nr:MAG: hypothetical protein UU13_C0002G0036 [Candidatus Nomurabacteria bacterium GW2011_GWB1_40_7]